MERIRFRLDEHVPHAIARGAIRRGVDVTTAAGTRTRGLPDAVVLARCLAEGRVLFTQDRDFVQLHHQGHPHAGLVFCEQGTRSIGEIVAFLVLIAYVYAPDEMVGRIEYA